MLLPGTTRHTPDEHPPHGAVVRFAFRFPSRVSELTGVYRHGRGIWSPGGSVKLARLPRMGDQVRVLWWEKIG